MRYVFLVCLGNKPDPRPLPSRGLSLVHAQVRKLTSEQIHTDRAPPLSPLTATSTPMAEEATLTVQSETRVLTC